MYARVWITEQMNSSRQTTKADVSVFPLYGWECRLFPRPGAEVWELRAVHPTYLFSVYCPGLGGGDADEVLSLYTESPRVFVKVPTGVCPLPETTLPLC